MEVQRQSPLRSSDSSKGSDEGFIRTTKEEVMMPDCATAVDSDNSHESSKLIKALEENRDYANKEKLKYGGDCKSQIPFSERQDGMPEVVTSAEDVPVQEEMSEPLDLSLPKNNCRENKEKCKWVLDSGYEGSLIMEVDEIEHDVQHIEVEQDEDDEECWFPLRNDDHSNNFHLENWDQQSGASIAISSPTCTSFLSPDPKDTLLIDDQGIPYTLTPDGEKVPQVDSSELPMVEELGPEDEAATTVQGADSVRELLLQNLPLGDCSGLSLETSQDTSEVEENTAPGSAVEANSAESPAISSLPSLPIQIMTSNTGSNTPILLLPQSQLQTLSSSATNAPPGVLALSLPLALTQNTQSSSVLFVLSSPQVSTGIQSSVLSGQLSQISPTSSVALLSASSLGLKTESVSGTSTTTNHSGQNKPCNLSSAPTSPTASSATSSSPAKQLKTETCSDTPTSFQEALLRLAESAVQKAENQSKSIEASTVVAPSTCSEATQSKSSPATHTPAELCETEQALSPTSEPTFIPTVDQSDSLLSADGLLPMSSTSPPFPDSLIFPSNHPKNQDPQALGPRRILYCRYCPRVFFYLSDLERHSITHSQNKPHVCQLCGKAFKRSSHLERHKHIHTGQRNFVCQLCPRRFREAAELTRHQRVHTGEKPFQCLLCHMRFAERNTLRRHTKRKHQGQQQEAMSMKVKPETEGVSLLAIQGQEEENAEWYSSTVAEMDSDNDMGEE